MLNTLVGIGLNLAARILVDPQAEKLRADELKAANDKLKLSMQQSGSQSGALQKRLDDAVAELWSIKNELNKRNAELDSLRQAHVAAAEAIAVALYDDEACPMYEGRGVHPSWWHSATERIGKQKRSITLLRKAIGFIVPWVDSVLRKGGRDDEVVLHAGQAPGSVHQRVVRRGEISALRQIYDATR